MNEFDFPWLSEKNILLLIGLVLFVIVLVVSIVLTQAEKKPQSPQALVAAAFSPSNSARAWRPLPQRSGLITAAAQKVYYEPTVRDIISTDCSQCHSGAVRNLMDYDSLRAYADSGMLAAMVQGPMAQFAGSDADAILAWVDAGAPEHPSKATAPSPAAMVTRHQPGMGGGMGVGNVAGMGGWTPLPQGTGVGNPGPVQSPVRAYRRVVQ